MESLPHKSPSSNARKAFEGKLFKVWQWDQTLFDGTTTMFEGVERPDSVEVVATVEDKIIIEEQEQPGYGAPFLSLPGGRADNGDTPFEEIKRELLEETGYASEDWRVWQNIPSPFSDTFHTVHYFIARECKKVAEPNLEGGEKISLRFVTFDELLALSDNPTFRGTEITRLLLRMRLHPEEREAFHKLLFGTKE